MNRGAPAGLAKANRMVTALIRAKLRAVHIVSSVAAPASFAVRIRVAFAILPHQHVPHHPGLTKIVLRAYGCAPGPPLSPDSVGGIWDFRFRENGQLMEASPEAGQSDPHSGRADSDKVYRIQGPGKASVNPAAQ